MARPREYDEHEVLSKAIEAFWTRGYEATSVSDLMEATGLAKGSLYKGFGDKRSLFLRALEHYLEQGRSTLAKSVGKGSSGAELLSGWLSNVAAMATCTGVRKGCMAVNCAVELGPHDDDIRLKLVDHQDRVEGFYIQLLEQGIADGSLRADLDLKATAEWINTVVHGLQVRGKLGLERKSADRTVAMTMAALSPA